MQWRDNTTLPSRGQDYDHSIPAAPVKPVGSREPRPSVCGARALAARYAIPGIYPFPDFPQAGGPLSYGVSLADAYRQVVTASRGSRTLRSEERRHLYRRSTADPNAGLTVVRRPRSDDMPWLAGAFDV